MRWDFHGITIEGSTNDDTLWQRWQTSFASRPPGLTDPVIRLHLDVVDSVPAPPDGKPQFRQGDLLAYYGARETKRGSQSPPRTEPLGEVVIAHFPRFGRLRLDLTAGTTVGHVVPAAIHTYGVLEDLIAIGLSPHLRRRGLFLIHAFAAAYQGMAVLLVGGIGAGKTTTGLALLDAGWQLLANDSPIINEKAQALSYPGVLAAYPDSFARFSATASFVHALPSSEGRPKLTLAAETIWPDVWIDHAPIRAICFPRIEPLDEHQLEPLSPPETLRRLLPHAVEQWDRPMIAPHLTVLRHLVEAAPGYMLRLGPDVTAIPTVLTAVLPNDTA